ncbi:NAD(P)H-dependent flavin oxidoreductase [Peribacillus sp. NPDC060253]|uniref:NAD(P)H-dependent flavin oxidoreductase n=1 Tax=Peribacillus sp. NPDC060253 TaxID=3347084 RepID=UPI00365D4A47
MKFRTAITDLLGIEYPIIQGGLHRLGIEPLVSAVSDAGGLGLLTAGSYPSKKEMIQDIELVRSRTDKPFGVNLAIGIRRPMDDFVDGAIEAGIQIVFTSGYSPVQYMEQFKNAGIKVIHVVPSLKYAKKAEELGCDAVVVVGFECGGHPGLDEVSSLVLLPEVVQELTIPVIAAGGFVDGKGLLAALSMGAQAVQMGTRFVMTEECPLHPSIKAELMNAGSHDTMIIKRSIKKTNRVYRSAAAIKVEKLEKSGAGIEVLLPMIGGEAYEKMLTSGDVHSGILSIGEGIGRIDTCKSARTVIEDIMKEAEESFKQINMYAHTSTGTL